MAQPSSITEHPTENTWSGVRGTIPKQKWYGTTGDMEYLRRFWQLNFIKYADFRPNYIVPNLTSITRCLTSGQGLAVIPDFLCRKEIESGLIKLVGEGKGLKIPCTLRNANIPFTPKHLL